MNLETEKSFEEQSVWQVEVSEGEPDWPRLSVYDGNKEIGALIGHHVGKAVKIDKLEVRTSQRGKGIGRALVEAFCQWGESKGANRVDGEIVVTDNKQGSEIASRFFDELGFDLHEPEQREFGYVVIPIVKQLE
jgi:GNAT superfamily N-acetyltransferase